MATKKAKRADVAKVEFAARRLLDALRCVDNVQERDPFGFGDDGPLARRELAEARDALTLMLNEPGTQ